METKDLIRKYRKMRGLTQVQLANATGQTDSAIRNYELGNRTPGEEQLIAIAAALNISPEALRQVPIENGRQALELLFRLQEACGLAPMEIDGRIVLGAPEGSQGAQKLDRALRTWMKKVDSLNAGDITQTEYDEWKAEFGVS